MRPISVHECITLSDVQAVEKALGQDGRPVPDARKLSLYVERAQQRAGVMPYTPAAEIERCMPSLGQLVDRLHALGLGRYYTRWASRQRKNVAR